jgi:hypothetical protein
MILTPAEQTAVNAHTATLGVTSDDYIHRSAAGRALDLQNFGTTSWSRPGGAT